MDGKHSAHCDAEPDSRQHRYRHTDADGDSPHTPVNNHADAKYDTKPDPDGHGNADSTRRAQRDADQPTWEHGNPRDADPHAHGTDSDADPDADSHGDRPSDRHTDGNRVADAHAHNDRVSSLKLEVCVDVDDVDRAVEFYGRGPGLTVVEHHTDWAHLMLADLTFWMKVPPDGQIARDERRHWTR